VDGLIQLFHFSDRSSGRKLSLCEREDGGTSGTRSRLDSSVEASLQPVKVDIPNDRHTATISVIVVARIKKLSGIIFFIKNQLMSRGCEVLWICKSVLRFSRTFVSVD
jgi:hypothetical protein